VASGSRAIPSVPHVLSVHTAQQIFLHSSFLALSFLPHPNIENKKQLVQLDPPS
jgi:hypothetical protein